MKKLFSLALCLALVLAVLPPARANAEALVGEDAITLSSPSAVLMEKVSGALIYEKDGHTRRLPASVTKVMTLLLIVEAVEAGDIALDDMVTGSARAASMGGSQVWLEEGEQLSVSDMIKCIAVVSANDCAVAMAEHLAGGEEAFVRRMNDRAAELGCKNTNFTDCTGLFDSPEHYTSAYDIALMSRALISHDWIKDYTTIWMDSIRDGQSELTNTNKLLRFYEGCTGLKTGYTHAAMYCLSATAEREGTEFIAVIMHGESIEKRNNDAKALLSYGFANYALCPLRSGEALAPLRVEMGEAETLQPVYSGPEALLLPKQAAKDLSYALDLPESVEAPVAKGQALGTLTVYSGSEEISRIAVLSGETVERLNVWGAFVKLLKIALS